MTTAISEPAEHGGPNLAELRRLGVDPATLLDFSVCTNPFGPSPQVREALADVRLEQYPDRDAHSFRAALGEKFAISPQRILAGNGVSELIWLAALALLRPLDRVLLIGPTYCEYARSAMLREARISVWNACEHDGFAVDVQAIERELRRCDPRLMFLCNPNNPTGSIVAPEAILELARRHPHTLFAIDEAYQGFVPGLASLAASAENNLLVLRSMTKDYALASLRVGYAVGSVELIAALAHVRPPWSVNSFAQTAASAALRDDMHLAQSLRKLSEAKADFVAGLTRLGLKVGPSATHYFLMRVSNAAGFRLGLLRKGILVRDAASFGLSGFVRLASRRPDENARLLAVLTEGA
jgi:histidinol-phosphate aminotransferase